MAAQIGALRVAIGADITGLQTGMARAQREVQRGASGMQKSVSTVTSSFKSLAAVAGVSLGLTGLAAGARAFLSIADASKSLTAQLRLATAEYGSFGQAQKDVQRIAEVTRSDLSATANLYAVFQRNAKELGISQAQAARATETVNKTFQISGATAEEAAGGLRQFLQALQSGQLRGEEFNSVMENAPRLARLLADSLGVTIGQLRALAKAGEITGDKLIAALTDRKFTEAIDREFQQLPVTFDQAMGQIYNAAVVVFGAFDTGGQFSTALSNFITGGTQGFADLERAAYDFGATLRGLFDTLDSIKAAFGSLKTDGIGAMLDIEGATISLRGTLSTLFGVIDGVANKFANLINLPGNLIRQATGVGGKPIIDPFNMRGVFDKTASAADLRRIASQGLDPSEWAGRTPPPFRAAPSSGKTKKGPKGPSAEALAAKAQREMEQRMRRDAAADNERARNNIELLRAEQDLTNDYQQRNDIARAILDIEREQDLKAVDLSVKLGDRTEAEGEALKLQIRDLDQMKRRVLQREEDLRAARDAAQLADADLDIQQQQFQAEAALAETSSEMRDAQLRLLDLAYRQEKARLEATIADEESSEAAKEEARRRLSALNARFVAERQGVLNNTRNPLEAWAASIPQTAAKIKESLQSITADGLDGISDAIGSIIDGSKSMAEAFGDAAKSIISDLIQMFTRMLMFQALQSAFGGIFGGAGSSVVGGAPTGANFIGPRAIGGPITPGRTYRVGEQGPELIRVGSRGQVIPNSEIGGGGIVINQHFAPNFAGNAATKQDLVMMGQITKAETMAAVRDARRRGR